MRIDPDLALTLAAVVDEGTLDAAASRLHLTPSAVSQRLKLLEEQLGQRLLVRSRPVRPTPAGETVVRLARQVALVEAEAVQSLGLSGTSAHPRVTVAVNADSLTTWLLAPVAAFATTHDAHVELVREDQDSTVALLEDGSVLAAVTTRAEPVAGCRSTHLGDMVFTAAAAPGWVARWAPHGPEHAALDEAPRVDFDRDDRLQSTWLQRRGVDPRSGPRHLVPTVDAFEQAVLLGLGWGMIPAERAEDLADAGRLVPLGGPVVTTTLYWQRWRGASEVLDALTDAVVAAARTALSPSDRHPA